MPLSILYVGPRTGTCEHRAIALRALGHDVEQIEAGPPSSPLRRLAYRLANRAGHPFDALGAGRATLLAMAARERDVVWIDKGREIHPGVLRRLRRDHPRATVVAYSPDDMMNPTNSSPRYVAGVPLYDLHVTTKSFHVDELQAIGAGDVLFVDNAYDPATHRPLELTPAEREKYAADVGFVGSMEEERGELMHRLAERGVPVSIWGSRWERFPKRHERFRVHYEGLLDLEYSKAINATRINLGFLRKINRDLQTTRSIEIPACGAFMLAERTDEHLRLFEEGKQAEFFSSFEELEQKCRYYVEHEDERARIARGGLERCRRDRYDNEGRMATVIERIVERHLSRG